MIDEEGLATVHERHRRLALATRAAATSLGFTVFPRHPSHAVTALEAPEGIEPGAIVRRLRDVHGIVIAGGQDRLKGKILRVGHMGHYRFEDIQLVARSLEECVAALGRPAAGAMAAAAAGWESA